MKEWTKSADKAESIAIWYVSNIQRNIYDFMRDNARIFTARCVEGTVIQVWDYRNDPIRPYIPKKSTTTDKEDDPYDVNDYSNEEDFYYDHYDDFFDYYDAEDYYDEHHQ